MLLALHIAGGVLSLLAAGYGYYSIVDDRHALKGHLVVVIPLLALYQIVTGLALLFQSGSVIRICITGTIYLAVMGWVEYRLLCQLPARRKTEA